MHSDVSPCSFWLIPEAPAFKAFSARIRNLAGSLESAPFPPHLTLFSTSLTDSAALIELTARAAGIHAPLSMTVKGLACTADFFRAFFVDLTPGPEAVALRRFLAAACAQAADPAWRPHLSLCYGELSPARQAALPEAESPPESIRFDALWLAAPRKGARDWRDIAAWRTLAQQPLRGELKGRTLSMTDA